MPMQAPAATGARRAPRSRSPVAPCRKAAGALFVRSRLHADFLLLCDLDPSVLRVMAPEGPLTLASGAEHRPDYRLLTGDGPLLVDVVRDDDEEAVPPAAEVAEAALAAGAAYRRETEESLRAEPRHTTLKLIGACRRVRVPAGERIRVLHVLGEAGGLPLVEAAGAAGASPDGVAAVLSLVCEGLIEIEVDGPLLPETMVRRPRASG